MVSKHVLFWRGRFVRFYFGENALFDVGFSIGYSFCWFFLHKWVVYLFGARLSNV